jgi:hypothetical protein
VPSLRGCRLLEEKIRLIVSIHSAAEKVSSRQLASQACEKQGPGSYSEFPSLSHYILL